MSQHTFGLTTVLLIVLFITVLGCSQPGSSKFPSSGSYKGTHLGCSEIIVLNSDGTFTQTIVFPSATYTNQGSWNHEIRGTGLAKQNKVVFRRFLVTVDTRKETLHNPPKEYSLYEGDWLPDNDRIEFDASSRYFVERAKN